MRKFLLFLIVMVGLVVFVGCGGGEPSEYELAIQQIHEILDQAEEYMAEYREYSAIYAANPSQLNAIFAGRAHSRAMELAEEAWHVAQEHGVDILELNEQRILDLSR